MLTNLIILVVIHTIAWAWAAKKGQLDALLLLRGVGVIALAVLSLPASTAGGMRAVLIAVLAMGWGARLTSHHIHRQRLLGPSRRWTQWKEQHGHGWRHRALWALFLPQAVLLWVCAAPIQRGIMAGVPLGASALDGVGLLCFSVGLGFEALADHQLLQFRSAPGGETGVLDDGAWALSRHPNHFGTGLVGVGFYFLAASGGAGTWSVVGPVLTWLVLARVSGGRASEAGMDQRRPGYARYRQRTSALLPRPPRESEEVAMPAETLRFLDAPAADPNTDLTED